MISSTWSKFQLQLGLFLILAQNQITHGKPTCGYSSCPKLKPHALNVHVVCHSHLDPGWKKTIDEYYDDYVQQIIDSVTHSLSVGQNRRFIFVETSFFSKWWTNAKEHEREMVKSLVASGQFEFTSGGWVMNDEATPNYQQIIDQMTLGHQWLNTTFGQCGQSRTGWQIDPFGHSREYASLLTQMGFDGLFLGRIDYEEKERREKSQQMEFVWQTNPSLGSKANLFTVVLPNLYLAPDEFCFDMWCLTNDVTDENADEMATKFIQYARSEAANYSTNNIIITMGHDFFYQRAGRWFTNLDKLFQAVNSKMSSPMVHVFYSTPSCYLKALNEAVNQKWSVFKEDFFPYRRENKVYWTGFFTSRPLLKYQIQVAARILNAARQLYVLANLDFEMLSQLEILERNVALLMHHDGITGTSNRHVVQDYTERLMTGINSGKKVISKALEKLIHLKEEGAVNCCVKFNLETCDAIKGMTFGSLLLIYNPLAHTVEHYVHLPIINERFLILDSDNKQVLSQVILTNQTLMSKVRGEQRSLLFRVKLPPLSVTRYKVIPPNENNVDIVFRSDHVPGGDIVLENGRIKVIFNPQSGLLSAIVTEDGQTLSITQNFYAYKSDHTSGVYMFVPTEESPVIVSKVASYQVFRGGLVQEIHQVFTPWIKQIVRLYKDVDYVDLEWTVGPIPLSHLENGLEIVSRFTSNLYSNGQFYTDSNGRQRMKRIRAARSSFTENASERISKNYYPVSSWIFLRDKERNLQLSLIPDRPEGGTSLEDGQLELMVHRSLRSDDGGGMDEDLIEVDEFGQRLTVRGRHRLLLGSLQESMERLRLLSKSLQNPPIVAVSQTKADPNVKTFYGMKEELPPNFHLLTLSPWNDGRVLLRLEHVFEKGEHELHSVKQAIDIRNLFTAFNISQVTQRGLNVIETASELEQSRLHWTTLDTEKQEGGQQQYKGNEGNHESEKLLISLQPMEIKTFLVKTHRRD